jgi:hypothetical protein
MKTNRKVTLNLVPFGPRALYVSSRASAAAPLISDPGWRSRLNLLDIGPTGIL